MGAKHRLSRPDTKTSVPTNFIKLGARWHKNILHAYVRISVQETAIWQRPRYRMTGVLSKLTPSVYELGRNALRPTQTIIHSVRSGGHGHLFVKRPGQMYVNRLKDAAHFYLIGVGLIPVLIAVFIQHTIFGPCELMDYPTEGPPPRCWQFERTPFRQLYVRLVGVSDMEYHERNMSYVEKSTILNRWRRIEKRVKHLQGERWDYKGYFYEPIYTTWIDVARKRHEQVHWNYEPHGSSTF